MRGNGECECGAFAAFAVRPNPAADAFHDFLTDGKAHTGAGVFATVQPLKRTEDALRKIRVESDAIVLDGDVPGAADSTGVNPDGGRRARLPGG